MLATFQIPEDLLRVKARRDGITHFSTGIAVAYKNTILLVRRVDDDYLGGYFELPGGGVEEGESFGLALRRELREEVGMEVKEIIGMFPGFDYSTASKPHVRQVNFLVRSFTWDVRLSAEHSEYRWVSQEGIGELRMTGLMKNCIIDALELAASYQ